MMKKGQGEVILVVVFLLGIMVELFYIVSILSSETRFDLILEKTFLSGIITSILIILVIVLIRQRDLAEQFQQLKKGFRKGPRTSRDVRRELAGLYRDLGALKIVAKDSLIDMEEYNKKKAALDARVKKKKEELRALERAEKKP
jgi:hypothetical protein